MAESTQFTIGASARCTDGECGEVTRVVIDPTTRSVTHIVVHPRHRQEVGRLVPLDLVETSGDEVVLRCSRKVFNQLDSAEETHFLPGTDVAIGYGPGEMFSWPYYGLGGTVPLPVTHDTVPVGEVAVRRGEPVHATDGDIGRVQGLVIDPRNRHVTHVLLQEGHLWGRKEVAIPIGAVRGVDGGIQLNLTRHEVRDLPAIELHHPAFGGS